MVSEPISVRISFFLLIKFSLSIPLDSKWQDMSIHQALPLEVAHVKHTFHLKLHCRQLSPTCEGASTSDSLPFFGANIGILFSIIQYTLFLDLSKFSVRIFGCLFHYLTIWILFNPSRPSLAVLEPSTMTNLRWQSLSISEKLT